MVSTPKFGFCPDCALWHELTDDCVLKRKGCPMKVSFLAAALAAVALGAAPAAAQPVAPPSNLPLEARVANLEARLAAVERLVAPPSNLPAAPAPRATAPVRAAGGHTHTCSRGHSWDHSMDGGSHDCPWCGEHVTTVSGFGPAPATVQYALPGFAAGGGCANGSCAAPARAVFAPFGGRFRR